MTRVLVTGSTGYLGSVLTPYLTEHGMSVVGYDTGFFRSCLLYPAPATTTIDRDARDITAADLDGIDAVVHLAGISNDPLGALDAARVYDPTRDYSRDIASMCKAKGVKFVFASSCSVYGLGGDELLTETSPLHPQTGYSLNKRQIEEDLIALSDRTFSPIALRFATVFGPSPRLRLDVVVNMLTGMAVARGKVILNSDGRSWRPNLHILDACEAIRRAIALDHSDGSLLILNVGTEANNLPVLELARAVQAEVQGCGLEYLNENPDLDDSGLIRDRKVRGGVDTRTYKVSFEKIRSVMPGFSCSRTVAQGVAEMVRMFREMGFNEETFKQRSFYRLQQLEHLHQSGALSDDLRWRQPRPV